jgi:proton-dependent oligopeptide transporter, POT family
MVNKHPKGLSVLFMTEMWERFGFYIMSAIYVLYMAKSLKFDIATQGNLYALFIGSCYLFPLVGGYLGDKVLGTITTVRTGAIMMTIGYTFLALSSVNNLLFFYIGLFMVGVGTGIFKVNMSTLLSNLYHDRTALKDSGFNIYYMGVNIGATIGPLTTNVIGIMFNNYNICFWSAAVGMLLAIAIFEVGKKKLIAVNPAKIAAQKSELEGKAPIIDKAEYKDRILTLMVLFPIAAMFWLPFYQNGFALTKFADMSTVQVWWLRPEVFQAFGAIFIILLTPIALWIFSKFRDKGKEPSTPAKIFFGMNMMGLAMLIMVVASLMGGNNDQNIMSPLWLIAAYFMITIGEILISPLGQSYVTKVAPPSIQGFMIGGWFSATAIGVISSGLFGKIYNVLPHHYFYLILAGISFFAAFLVFISMNKLKKYGG